MQPSPNDIVAVSAVRSPMGKFGGSLKNFPVYHLGAMAIRQALARSKISAKAIDDVILGCCRHAGNGTNPARTAARYAGLLKDTPATTITMACASGMRAVIFGMQALRCGDASLVVTGGMENMSRIPYILLESRWEGFQHGHKMLMDGWYDSRDPFLRDQGTGITTEKLIARYGITRQEQDQFAFESQKKASQANKKGLFDEEIIPIEISRNGNPKQFFRQDETIRKDTSLAKLSKLQPVFEKSGTLTAGNSSPFSDGAAIIIFTTRKKAKDLGIKPLFRIVSYAFGAVENACMGEGPSVILPLALKKVKMTLKDLNFLEINEAFAGVILVTERLLHLDRTTLNKHGGALALGHAVGCSGARILVTLYHTLKCHNQEIGAAAIGGAGGVSAATVIQRES